MVEWLMNDDYERLWKEEVVTYFKVLSLHLHFGIEINHEKSQDSRYQDRDLNQRPSEYGTWFLAIRLQR
jgi:hypothetical protein